MIAALEEISLNALPAIKTMFYDGWILRMSGGYTRRANSVQTFGACTQPLAQKIAYCERLYRDHGLPATFKMTAASQPPTLDQELEARGYRAEASTSVQTCALAPFALSRSEHVCICEKWSDEWFAEFCRMRALAPAQRADLEQLLRLIVPQTGYALLTDQDGVRACGLGVVQEKHLGLFDIEVDQMARRRGYGKELVMQLLMWGKTMGAETAYLQVSPGNEAAVKLYAQLGFVEQYRYRYRVHT